jgi:sigma-B regulation protein RsbU (phosphoserine phosphatase)
LGIFDDVTWDQEIVQLNPGDTMVLYTDGVTEAQNSERQLFGEPRLLECGQANRGRSARDIQNAILAEVSEFAGESPQLDDITLAVIVRKVLS